MIENDLNRGARTPSEHGAARTAGMPKTRAADPKRNERNNPTLKEMKQV